MAHATEPIRDALGDLRPLRLSVVESGSADLQLFQLPAPPLPLPRPPQHGGREPPLSGTRSRRPAAGLRAVRIGRVEVRRARCLHRMGTPGAGTQPLALDQQHALFWSCPGSRWPHLASHLLGVYRPTDFAPTGRASMAIRLMRWKPSWIAAASGEPATGRPTGCPSAPPRGGAATTGTMASASPSRRSTSTP